MALYNIFFYFKSLKLDKKIGMMHEWINKNSDTYVASIAYLQPPEKTMKNSPESENAYPPGDPKQ